MSALRVVVLRDTAAEPLGAHVTALRDLGFEVHVLAKGDALEDGPLLVEDVAVSTVPVPKWLGAGRHGARSPRWTKPLGYRTLLKAGVRQAAAQARVSESMFQRDVAFVKSGNTKVPLVPRARLFLARAERRWVAERTEATREAYKIRKGRRRPVDRAARRLWRTTSRQHAWARLDPALLDPELHLGPALDELAPDVMHAEGPVMMSVAVRAAARIDHPVRVVWDRTGEKKPKRPWAAQARPLLVAEYGHRADATVKARDPQTLAAAYGAAPTPTLEGTP